MKFKGSGILLVVVVGVLTMMPTCDRSRPSALKEIPAVPNETAARLSMATTCGVKLEVSSRIIAYSDRGYSRGTYNWTIVSDISVRDWMQVAVPGGIITPLSVSTVREIIETDVRLPPTLALENALETSVDLADGGMVSFVGVDSKEGALLWVLWTNQKQLSR